MSVEGSPKSGFTIETARTPEEKFVVGINIIRVLQETQEKGDCLQEEAAAFDEEMADGLSSTGGLPPPGPSVRAG
ncbi:hypothetical protein ACFLZP_02405 [Patescibacteria group bacterium]